MSRLGRLPAILLTLLCPLAFAAPAAEPPRSSHALEAYPYYPGKDYPKLITPQWVGEEGVDAVVVLAIDDMSDPAKHEAYLRPIIDRLKAIDGRAPVSVMTNKVDPNDPRLQRFLKDGLSIEIHTTSHPCPFLHNGDFAAAQKDYHGCVDLMSRIPGNKPVAFRMPCCDSMNTPGPRFFAELFNKTSPDGNFLAIDSSVMNIFTPDDPSLPRDLVFDENGGERFRKYVPFPSFVNTIENYPYPYVIGGLCWEFPGMVPDDWEGHNLNTSANPKTIEDMKASLDLVVHKKGVYNLIFHPYAWIKNTQVVELIDHAQRKHGGKVKFLNFREALERLNKNLLDGHPLRDEKGADNGVELADLNNDGYLDVARTTAGETTARVWDPQTSSWKPLANAAEALRASQAATEPRFDEKALPPHARRFDDQGRDAGLRFVDLDEDGHLDVVFSNDEHYGVYLFDPSTNGWTRKLAAGAAGEPGALPKIVKNGQNNGFFAHSRSLWWQNEDTDKLPDKVDRRSFNDLLGDAPPLGRTPEQSLRSIRVSPGFQVELTAAEPLIKDPIAIEWGADGKLWVLEMGDYPLGTDGQGRAGGTVRVLEDVDGDGRYDKATTFLDRLAYPSGIMPWRNGVLIGCAPDLFYAEDRDGDGKADHREVLFTGFGEGNQQHRFNGFELGLDGWIYGANGDSDGVIRSLKTGNEVNIQGRDFRFNPDTGAFETESGRTQYGRRRDDWGDWFGDNNPTWAWHYVLAESDVRRNPRFAPPDPRRILEPETGLFPISRTLARFNEPHTANHATSTNSPTPYRDELFGPHYRSSLFVSEPVHNLVHRMVLEPDGSTFRGVRGPDEAKREFLASSDNWFRPTQMKTGPDGALWIVDMYRAVIEHPEWIPPETQKVIDLRAGSDMGRLYRVFPVDQRPRPIPRLDGLDAKGLVAALESPSGWQRDTAQRLLMHANDPAAVEPLKALIAATGVEAAKVQAIWTLSLFDGLDDATARACLNDPRPRVKTAVVQATRGKLDAMPQTKAAILALDHSTEPRLRFQMALAMGDCKDPDAGRALARIALEAPDDPWLRAAVFSSAAPHVDALLVELLAEGGKPAPNEIIEPLVGMFGEVLDAGTLDSIVRRIAQPKGARGGFAPWQFSSLAKLAGALERSGRPIEPTPENGLANVLDAARAAIANEETDAETRISAVALIGLEAAKSETDRDILINLISPQTPIEAQEAALAALARSTDPTLPSRLLEGWRAYSPRVRSAVLDLIVSRAEWAGSLLSLIEKDEFPRGDVDANHRSALLASPDAAIRDRAKAQFAKVDASRKAVVDAHRPALAMKGDAAAGRAVFERVCAVCHKIGDVGVEVGPDLAALNDRSPESLLIAILDPNAAFEAKYTNFTAALNDGRVLTGMISAETANSVTLLRGEGKEDVLLRRDIDELTSSGQSLMTEGLESELSQRDLADLISYLSNLGQRP